VIVDETTHQWLLANPGAEVTIDLEATTLGLPDGSTVKFPIDAFPRYCLLNGVDELGFLLSKDPAIRAYEARHPA
jgi:3-isopropylmalate/(R)-2-methylmalate dehydratase small subunit